MRKIHKLFIMLLTLVLCFSLSTIPAFAASASQDGLEVTLVTDKTAYEQDEQITATLVVVNTNEQPVNNVSLKHIVPDGYKLADGSTDTKEIESIDANDYVSFEVVYTAKTASENVTNAGSNDQSNASDNTTTTSNNLSDVPAKGTSPLTGETANILIGLIIFVASFIGIVLLLRLKKDKKVKALSVLLSVVIAGSSTIFVVGQVYATETDRKTLAVETQVTVADKEMTLNATVTYSPVSEIDMEKDSDADGLSDVIEQALGTDPNKSDTDGDGLTDSEELQIGTDPTLTDTDNNGVWDGDEDADGDGLTNLEEIKLGTDPTQQDTDTDGLTDYEEQQTYNTDPTNEDTDGDGATDGWEVANQFDPLTPNENFDVSVSSESENITASVDLQVSGEQASTVQVEETDQELFIDETVPGYIGSAFDFSVDGTFEEATISFTFDETLLNDPSFVPAIYYWNEETQMFEELETTVSDNVASTTVTHFSTYILLNKTEFDQVWNAEIKPPNYEEEFSGLDVVFVIDSSGSMSSNDYNELRLEAAKQFVAKLGDKDRAAVIDFDNYASLYQAFTSDHEALNNAIDRIDDSGGTNLSSGISLAINQFTSDAYDRTDAAKYIIFLTDGDGSYSTSYTQTAANNGITIYTIGLGSGVRESTLRAIAEGTDGKYYFASTPDVLLGIYNEISLETVDYQTDSNHDGISDYFTRLLCDGTLLLGTGKDNPFKGYSYDDVQKNDDFDGDDLKNGEELVVTAYASLNRVYVQMQSDPTSEDTDFDGAKDSVDYDRLDNTSTGKINGNGDRDIKDAEYTLDLRDFFKSPDQYNPALSTTSLILSNAVYSGGNGFKYDAAGGNVHADDMLVYHGFNKVESHDLKKTYKDDYLTAFDLGYREVTYNGKTKTIVAVVVRGTDSSVEEWSNNFDMGNPDDGKNSWTSKYHKGFYQTEERVRKLLDQYVDGLNLSSDVTYWITGHSRGAAIANILSAKLIDEGNEVFAYTFATPSVIMDSSAENPKYDSIFNIINTSDIVPYLPLELWGYKRYGQSLSLNIKQFGLQGLWLNQTGKDDYDALSPAAIILITTSLYSCATAVNNYYTISDPRLIASEERQLISKRAKRFCDLTSNIFDLGYWLSISPAFVFQLVAEALATQEYASLGILIHHFLLQESKYRQMLGNIIFVLFIDWSFNFDVVYNGHSPATYYILTSYQEKAGGGFR